VSRTPKVVRRNGGNCVCPEPDRWNYIDNHRFDDGFCKKGYCYSAKCRTCHGELFGMGPVYCPCEHPRWARYRGMEQLGHWDLEKDMWVPTHVAVKLSISKRRGK
jgi:hypothetical protein